MEQFFEQLARLWIIMFCTSWGATIGVLVTLSLLAVVGLHWWIWVPIWIGAIVGIVIGSR